MNRSIRRALSFVLLPGAAALLAMLVAPSATTGPYLSALSDALAAPAAAAGGCASKACDLTQFRTCIANPGTVCIRNVKTAAGCSTKAC